MTSPDDLVPSDKLASPDNLVMSDRLASQSVAMASFSHTHNANTSHKQTCIVTLMEGRMGGGEGVTWQCFGEVVEAAYPSHFAVY